MTDDTEWWRSAVVYQVYLRSFADSDGDGLGDLRGLIRRLDYLQQLGVDVVWVTPFYVSPQVDNGYDIADYDAVDPVFGTEADFDELVAGVHARGMKLIIDVVLNHTSDQHPWFVESRASRGSAKRDWYIWRSPREGRVAGEPGAEPTNLLGFFAQPTWTYDQQSGEYYFHLFAGEQPDLNWENPEVRDALYAMLRGWLARGVDGFRLDVINLISKRYPLLDVAGSAPGEYGDDPAQYTCGPRLEEFLAELKREVFDVADRELLTVGEMPGVTVAEAKRITGGPDPLLGMVFTFEHMDVDHMPGWARRYEPRTFDLRELKRVMANWQGGLADSGWNSLYFGNHDQARSLSRFGSADPEHRSASAKALATVLHLHRGTPYVYQGDEIGMANYPFQRVEDFKDLDIRNSWSLGLATGAAAESLLTGFRRNGRDNARTPFQWDGSEQAGFTAGVPWIPVNPDKDTINVAAQVDDEDSILAHYRRLIALRHRSRVIALGSFRLLAPEHPALYAFERSLDGETLLVLANLSNTEVALTDPDLPPPGVPAELVLTNLRPNVADRIPEALRPWEACLYRNPAPNAAERSESP